MMIASSSLPSRVDGLTCEICNVFCGQQRAFKAHLRTIEHAKKAGQPLPEQSPCPQCDKGFTRKAGVERHLRHGQCRGPSTAAAPSISPGRKRPVSTASLEKPAKHMRTDSGPMDLIMSPVSDDARPYDRDSTIPRVAESISVHVVDMRKHGKVTDVTSLPSPPQSITAVSQEDIATPVRAVHTGTPPAVDDSTAGAYEDIATPVRVVHTGTPPTVDDSGAGAYEDHGQIDATNSLSVPSDVPAMPSNENQDPTDCVTPLSDAFKRVSLEVGSINLTTEPTKEEQRIAAVKARNRTSTAASFRSTQSKQSVASLGSIGSLFLSRSPRESLSGSLRRSSSSSTRSSGGRTTFSEDMPAPMLEPIDEELHFSRKQESFWDRYKLKRGPQKLFGWAPHPAYLWDYAAQGNVEGIRRTLSFGKVDVNSPDQYGWTALLTASSHGYADIVELLLQRKDIDVEYQDAQGSTALSWAASNGHLEVVKLLLASGKIEKHQDRENGAGCAALTWATMKGHSEIVELLMKELFSEPSAADEE